MKHLNVTVPVKNIPELDENFIPMGLFNREFLKGAAKPVSIAVERSCGQIARVDIETSEFAHNVGKRNKSGKHPGIHLKQANLFVKFIRPLIPQFTASGRGQSDGFFTVLPVKCANIMFDQRQRILFRQLPGNAFFRIVGDQHRNFIGTLQNSCPLQNFGCIAAGTAQKQCQPSLAPGRDFK